MLLCHNVLTEWEGMYFKFSSNSAVSTLMARFITAILAIPGLASATIATELAASATTCHGISDHSLCVMLFAADPAEFCINQ